MKKGNRRDSPPTRFETGAHGGCEASLFQFSEGCSSEPHIIRIAAVSLDDALAYMRWREPDFVIENVQNIGLILVVSGSPVD
jgi:hypothetical protein